MPKTFDDGDMISEYGNWNSAADYARFKIMRPLYLADEYETIATFGSTDFEEEGLSEDNIDLIKIKGFSRLVKTLVLVINNSLFAIRKKPEKEKLEGYLKELKGFYKVLPTLHRKQIDQRRGSSKIVLNQENFDKALERVSEIKALINDPLNKHDLIFTHTEEFDPVRAKEEFIKRATEIG